MKKKNILGRQEKEPLEQKNGTEQVEQTPVTPKAPEAEAAAASEAAQMAETLVVDDSAEQETYTLTAEEFAAAKAHIEALQKEKDETVLLLQRNQADFDNFRRRNASVRMDSYEEGKQDALKSMLPVLDSFERALASVGEADTGFAEGVKLVQRTASGRDDKTRSWRVWTLPARLIRTCTRRFCVKRRKARRAGKYSKFCKKATAWGDKIIRHAMVKVAE